MTTLHLAKAIDSLTRAYSKICFASTIGEKIFEILVRLNCLIYKLIYKGLKGRNI